MSTDLSRRNLLKTAGMALALIPLSTVSRTVCAKTNPALRAQLKYKDTPQDNMTCTSCLEFIPGKISKDLGGCKVIPGDDEISPNGYCTKWNSM